MRADYRKAVRRSTEVLKDHGFDRVPIDLSKIFNDLRLTLAKKSYSDFAKTGGLTILQVIEYFESDLGACAYNRTTEQYVIYYNDTKNNPQLDRFTIAHELGHVFLNHYSEVDSDVLLRKKIARWKYRRFENEANCFARNLLAPVPLVEEMIDLDSPMVIPDMQAAFNISFQAANARLGFFNSDLHAIHQEDYGYFRGYNINFGYYCNSCKSGQACFCKICGIEANPYNKIHDRIFYPGFNLDQDKKTTICPQCNNIEFCQDASYCRFCGTGRVNWCISCSEPNDGNARFCIKCGSKTNFYENNFLKTYNNKDSDFKGADAVYYNDGVEMNNVLRVIECPRCGNEEFSDNAGYCRICGLTSYNYCEGQPEYDGFGEENVVYHKNLGNARYCETCGRSTAFLKEGILKSWEQAKPGSEESSTADVSFDDIPF
jgi:Zn-dependent peptidase ImmA (M78 family)/ribosomal protein L37E